MARMTSLDAANGVGSYYTGLGSPTPSGSGHDFTVSHTGFKIIKTGGVISLYATQADETTENASGALTTLIDSDELDLIVKINSTTSVDYYWRKNGGSLSSATNLTSNMPSMTAAYYLQNSASNNATAVNFIIDNNGMSYER